MDSLLNNARPPVFCPGCSHERIVHGLDKALQGLGLPGNRVVIVSDIGCSGLFDTFFNTHAFHGLHGRALTYATGLKLARPDLTVIVTMGDGGMGIGGAHFLSACRRNIDITLLVLNNFNYGMTGGQCSATTPADAQVGSGFLNRLEKPLDICTAAAAAGAGWVMRVSSYDKAVVAQLQAAVSYPGFSVMDLWGICPGRYTRKNKLSPTRIDDMMAGLPPADGPVAANQRPEYAAAYRQQADALPPVTAPAAIPVTCSPPSINTHKLIILGSAGQRIVTAGELVCLAGASAGLHATQKNDYPITVMRGHSISETILSATAIDYTGIDQPDTVLGLAPEGVARRRPQLARLDDTSLIMAAEGIDLPGTAAAVRRIDFGQYRLKPADWALAALAVMAAEGRGFNREMLERALALRFSGGILDRSLAVVKQVLDTLDPGLPRSGQS